MKLVKGVSSDIDFVEKLLNKLPDMVNDVFGKTARELEGMVVNTIRNQEGGPSSAPSDVRVGSGDPRAAGFVTGTTPPWEPLSEKWAKKRGSSTPILIWKGDLISDIEAASFTEGENIMWKVGIFWDIGKAAAMELGFSPGYEGSAFGKIVKRTDKHGNERVVGIPPRSFLTSTINRNTGELYKRLINRIKNGIEGLG